MTADPKTESLRPTYDSGERYKIVRIYKEGGRRVIKRGLTLEQAQAHCKDPQTSSSTCTTAAGKRRTRVYGDWFDGYVRDA